MGDKYIHNQRLGEEIIFLTLSHSEGCKNLTIDEIRKISKNIFKNLPYENNENQIVPTIEYDDSTANDCERYGGNFITNALMEKVYNLK